jgi:N-acetylmuramoyl-L-alanine amidase
LPSQATLTSICEMRAPTVQVFRLGDDGPAVAEVQAALVALGLLPGPPDEPAFDTATDRAVRAFQQDRGLVADGVVGPETWGALQAARLRLGDRILSWTSRMLVGDDVTALQERLAELGIDAGRPDGLFGPRTEAALKAFQRDYGLRPDGVCGPATLRALRQLGRLVVGGRPQVLREAERIHASGAALAGKVVVIDPGHGGDDRGGEAHGMDEASIVEDLAFRLEGRLQAMGVRVLLTRGWDGCPTDEERAAFANDAAADLLLSLHVGRADSPRCEGVATYHFGTSELGSTVGERLASLVQREVVARTGLTDCRAHPKTWTLLRLTQMPAVRLELGHLTHQGDAARLADDGVRDAVAEALLVAVQRLYLPQEQDPPTGALRLPSLTG